MPKRSRSRWYVYLVRCRDGSLYTGITKDVARRCEQHNAGTASRYTRSRLPVALVYQEPQTSQSLALKREAAIKAMTRPEKELLIGSCGRGLRTGIDLCASRGIGVSGCPERVDQGRRLLASVQGDRQYPASAGRSPHPSHPPIDSSQDRCNESLISDPAGSSRQENPMDH